MEIKSCDYLCVDVSNNLAFICWLLLLLLLVLVVQRRSIYRDVKMRGGNFVLVFCFLLNPRSDCVPEHLVRKSGLARLCGFVQLWFGARVMVKFS